ncbi:hypothetical protein RUR49_11280, partial [Pseudoxanthobacter sp. M-2]|uniref:hypothetical protein n=1 Tax=Pseudoxanthobacter sp. M-2 TaxID=3078754 RepID=UPI0038FC7592
MRTQYDLPIDDQISIRVAVRFALYGVVLTNLFDEPVDREEYRSRAQPGYLLYDREDADGYRMRKLFLGKMLEAIEQSKLRLQGYRITHPKAQPSFDWIRSSSLRSDSVVNEHDNEIFDLNHPFDKSIDRTVSYFEFSIPTEAKNIYRLWRSVTVDRSEFIRFLDRIGIFHKADGASAAIDSPSRASADLVIKQYGGSGRVVERHFSEVKVPNDEKVLTTKREAASALPSNSEP